MYAERVVDQDRLQVDASMQQLTRDPAKPSDPFHYRPPRSMEVMKGEEREGVPSSPSYIIMPLFSFTFALSSLGPHSRFDMSLQVDWTEEKLKTDQKCQHGVQTPSEPILTTQSNATPPLVHVYPFVV